MTEREQHVARWRIEFEYLTHVSPEEYLARWNIGKYQDGWEENTWGMWARALLAPTIPDSHRSWKNWKNCRAARWSIRWNSKRS